MRDACPWLPLLCLIPSFDENTDPTVFAPIDTETPKDSIAIIVIIDQGINEQASAMELGSNAGKAKGPL